MRPYKFLGRKAACALLLCCVTQLKLSSAAIWLLGLDLMPAPCGWRSLLSWRSLLLLPPCPQALPCLSESELPPAVGLVLKLASESGAAQGLAVRVVRQRIRAAAGTASAGTLDAVRLAVLQHRGVARAMLADIEADAREALALAAPSGAAAPGELVSTDTAEHAAAAASAPSGRQGRQEGGRRRRSSSTGSTGAEAAVLPPLPQQQAGPSIMPEASYGPPPPAPPRLQLQLCDMEVLLDLLSLPDLQRDAVRTAELCCAAGTLHEEDVAALVERRRVQQLAAAAPAHAAFAPLEVGRARIPHV